MSSFGTLWECVWRSVHVVLVTTLKYLKVIFCLVCFVVWVNSVEYFFSMLLIFVTFILDAKTANLCQGIVKLCWQKLHLATELFLVAASRLLWNTETLSKNFTSAPSLAVFRKCLERSLQLFFPPTSCSARAMTCHFRHYLLTDFMLNCAAECIKRSATAGNGRECCNDGSCCCAGVTTTTACISWEMEQNCCQWWPREWNW